MTSNETKGMDAPSCSMPRAPKSLAISAVYLPTGGGATDLFRVLHVDASRGRAALIRLFGKNLPYWRTISELQSELVAGLLLRAEYPPDAGLAVPDEHLSVTERETRERRWAVIKEIVLDPERPDLDRHSRGQAVQTAHAACGCTCEFVYDVLRLYWTGGQVPNALLGRQHRCGARGKPRAPRTAKRGAPNALVVLGAGDDDAGVNITEALRQTLRDGALKFYWTNENLSVKDAYTRVLDEYFRTVPSYDPATETVVSLLPPPRELPTVEQFYRYGVDQLWRESPELLLKRRVGERSFNQRNRPVTTGRRPSLGPGDVAELDWTQLSVILVSRRIPGREIGPATVYAVREAFGPVATGFAVGIEPANYNLCRVALENALTDKVEFCARYGVAIRPEEWPYGMFRRLICDRGSVELGRQLRGAVELLGGRFGGGASVSNLPPARPDWKPLIERLFGHLKPFTAQLPGARPGIKEVGQPRTAAPIDPPRLTVDDITRILILFFRWFNNHYATPSYVPHEGLLRDQVPPYAVDRWRWGITHLRGAPVEIDRQAVRRALLVREDNVRPSERGVLIHGLHYVAFDAGSDVPADALQRYVGPTLRATGREQSLVTGFRDPNDCSFAWVGPEKLTSDTQQLQILRLHPEAQGRYGGCTDFELEWMKKLEKAAAITVERSRIQSEGELLAQVGSIVKDAQSRFQHWDTRTQDAQELRHEQSWVNAPISEAERLALSAPQHRASYVGRPPRLDLAMGSDAAEDSVASASPGADAAGVSEGDENMR